jgi:galactose mutarotase-like enzyme
MEMITLENQHLALSVIPELGCKISSIYDKKNAYEWLWQDGNRPFRYPRYGDPYDAYDISGFDECFPNIGISSYPNDLAMKLLDHGEIWSIPWSVSKSSNVMHCQVHGQQFNFDFERIITLEERTVKFEYTVTNYEEFDFISLWSAHALFEVSGDMELSIMGNPIMRKEFGFSNRMGPDGDDGYLGQFSGYKWPLTSNESGELFDLSKISLSKPLTDKVVLEADENFHVGLLDISTNRNLTMKFSRKEIPYLGICYNLGAWPSGEFPARWVALEPTNGCTDKLSDSFERGAFSLLAKNESSEWSYSIDFN